MSPPSRQFHRITGPRALAPCVLLVLTSLAAAVLAVPAARAASPDEQLHPRLDAESDDPTGTRQTANEGQTEVVPEGDPNAGVQIIRGLPDATPPSETAAPRTGADLDRAARSGRLTAAELEVLAERTDLEAARLMAAHCTSSGDDPGLVAALAAWHRADPSDPEPPFKLALLSQTQGDPEGTVRWADVALQRSDTFPARVRERQTLMLAALAARAAHRQGKSDLARVYAKRYVSVALAEKSRVPEDIRDLALDPNLRPPAP